MRVRVLGDLEVVVGGMVADLGGPKPRTLFALLVAARGRPVAVEQLIDQIWGTDPPPRVEASLQSYVARLRRALEPERTVGQPAGRLRTHAGGYSLDTAAEDVDAGQFASFVRNAQDRGNAAEQLLTEALGLWRGDAYAGMTSPVLAAEAARLEELRLTATEDLAALRIRSGRAAQVVPELERLARLHPLREQLWTLLARARYATGRQGDALAALRQAREHLADELGIDPGPELRRVEELMLRQDPSLESTKARSTAAAVPGGEPAATIDAQRSNPPAVGLFGRAGPLESADEVLRAAVHGRGRTVIVSGEAGIGKTRFTEALVARAEGLGFRCGRGAWEADACPPLWGWTRAVDQLLGRSGVLDASGDVVDAASASFRQAETLTGVLRDGPPALLVLDDVHWADTESLRLLRRVSAQVSALPVVLVVAVRSAAAEQGTAVVDALAALARVDPLRLELGGLDAEAITAWVADYAGVRVSAEVAAELTARTDGNPFYVTEVVRLLVREGGLATGAWRVVPSGVRDVVRQRLAQLPAESGLVIGTAAVVGRSFDLLVVARAAEVTAEQVDVAVESALMLGLVDELEPGRYRFTHMLVRDAVYEGLPAPTRARTHAAVGIALEHRHAGEILAHIAELAEHYRLAGPAYARSAWVFARRAGFAAAAQSAHDAALRLLTEAAALQDLDPLSSAVERAEVALGQAVALIRLGRPIEAWPAVARAARWALDRDDVPAAAEALLTITTSSVWGWRNAGDYDDEAIALWETVLDRIAEGSADTRARLQAGLAVELLYRPGSAERSTALADEAVQAVRRPGTPDAVRYRVMRMAAQAYLRPDLIERRLPLHHELIELATVLGDPSGVAAVLTARGSDRVDLGRFDDAHADFVRADELSRRHRLPSNLLVAGWCLTTWRHMHGDLDGAEAAIAEQAAFQGTLAMAGEGIALCQLAIVRLLQGRLPEIESVLAAASEAFPLFREPRALALIQSGRVDEARRLLGAWAEQPPLPWDYLWPGFSTFRAWVWIALGDQAAIADLRQQLLPYGERFVVGSIAVCFLGSADLVLGQLAAAAGDVDAARTHLLTARQAHADRGLAPWLARTDEALAALPPG